MKDPLITIIVRPIVFLWVVGAPALDASEKNRAPLTSSTSIEFVSANHGSELLRQRDDFIRNLSPLDRQLRLESADDVSTDAYVTFVAEQTLDFTDQELKKIHPLVEAISQQLSTFDIQLPKTIAIVKTNGKDEGGAAYCRGSSTIVLPLKILNAPAARLQATLTHELFHILSRHDKDLRDKMYKTIGFQRVTFSYPASLLPRKITNPDAAILSHVIQLKLSDEKTVSAIPITYSKKKKYDEGSLFDYLTFRLLVVQLEEGIATVENLDALELLEPGKQIDYFRQIGRNTGYIIHPEEILADNFVHLVNNKTNLPNPEIVNALRQLLQAKEDTTRE